MRTAFTNFGKDFINIYGELPDWRQIFKSLDTNQDGKISFQQFMVGAFDKPRILNDANLRVAFNLLDRNGDGKIMKEEVRDCF